jgi:hypothetical protein
MEKTEEVRPARPGPAQCLPLAGHAPPGRGPINKMRNGQALLRGRCPFRGERERTPCFFWRAHALRSKSEELRDCSISELLCV